MIKTASGSALMTQSCALYLVFFQITSHACINTRVFAAVPSLETPTFSHGGMIRVLSVSVTLSTLSLSTANSSQAKIPTPFATWLLTRSNSYPSDRKTAKQNKDGLPHTL